MSSRMISTRYRSAKSCSAVTAILLLTLCSSGCATVMSEKRYPVTIENAQSPTFFSIHDRKNDVIQQGVTPQQVTLDAKAFPFWPAKYSVVFAGHESSSQKQEFRAGFDPWIAGNLLLGGIPGAVVDGATGAMFRLPKKITGSVPPQFAVTDLPTGSAIAKAKMQAPATESIAETDSQAETMLASQPSATATPAVQGTNQGPVRAASAVGNEIISPSFSR